jgi:hypothetical protein
MIPKCLEVALPHHGPGPCGQHPAYYAGKESDPVEAKTANLEYPGQEHFYAAGGAAVRMRTAGNQTITVARLGVQNGRLYLVGTVMKTIDSFSENFKL